MHRILKIEPYLICFHDYACYWNSLIELGKYIWVYKCVVEHMNLDCSILLEDKQRFKSGGVMCVDFIYFYACFDAHLHTLSLLDLCISILPAFLLAYLLFLFGDLLLYIFCTQESNSVKILHSWIKLMS